MHRNSLSEMSARVFHQIVRLTLNKANDNPMMQEMDFDGMNSEGRNAVERIQSFGFTSMPLPRDQQQGQQQSSNGSGTQQPKGPAAEGIAVFLNGQRNHPVVIAVDDRRHRPMGLKPGENAQYDDQGQMTLLRRGGLFLLSLDDEQQSSSGSHDTGSGGSGQSTTRMVSLRHVQKKKQQRGKVGSGSGSSSNGSGGGGASAGTLDATSGGASQSQQDYKHEGETVNTEVRCTKNLVQIFDGETMVGQYDKSSGTWTFTSKNITLTAHDHLTVECTNGVTDIKGKPIKFNGGGPDSPPFQVPG